MVKTFKAMVEQMFNGGATAKGALIITTEKVIVTTPGADNKKELIADGIVRRQSYDEIPPRVEYSLAEKGTSVVPILQSICRWSGIFSRKRRTRRCPSASGAITDKGEILTQIHYVLVHPDYQGRGIAGELVEAFFVFFRRLASSMRTARPPSAVAAPRRKG